jgi:hypothetical protein
MFGTLEESCLPERKKTLLFRYFTSVERQSQFETYLTRLSRRLVQHVKEKSQFTSQTKLLFTQVVLERYFERFQKVEGLQKIEGKDD